jgi:hypothetical protein
MNDLRIAARSLAHNRSFAADTVLTLALGIGLTSAVFTLVNGVLLTALPFREPERVMQVTGTMRKDGVQDWSAGYLDIEQLRGQPRLFEAVSPVAGPRSFNLASAGETEHLSGGAPWRTVRAAPA